MKLILATILLLSFQIWGFSQTFNWVGSSHSTNDYSLIEPLVVIDAEGNVFSTGHLYPGVVDLDPGDGVYEVEVSLYDRSTWVQKLDSAGNFLWAKVFHGDCVSREIEVDAEGNVYIAGFFLEPTDFDPDEEEFIMPGSAPNWDVFLVKLNTEGDFEWAQNVGAGGLNSITSLSVGLDGVYLSGSFENTIDIDPSEDGVFYLSPTPDDPEVTGDWSDNYIRKVGFDGTFIWGTKLNSYDQELNMTHDLDGNLLITGLFVGEIDLDPFEGEFLLTSPEDSYSSFLLKLDETDAFVWGTSWDYHFEYSSLLIDTDPVGDIYLAGRLNGEVDMVPGIDEEVYTTLSRSMHVTKLDADGNFLWTNVNTDIDSPYGTYLWSMSTDSEGHTYVCGGFLEFGFDIAAGPEVFEIGIPDSVDSFLMHIDAEGNFVEASVLTGPSFQRLFSVDCSPLGFMVCVGTHGSATDFDMGSEEAIEEIPPGTRGNFFVTRLDYECYDYSNVTTTSVIECESYLWEVNGETYESSGLYKVRFKDVTGCDSIHVLDYFLAVDSILVTTLTECNSFLWPESGEEYTESGLYGFSYTNIYGCDSVHLIDLTIIANDLTITRDELELKVNTFVADSYQWGKCTDAGFEPIDGAIYQEYNVTENGDYAVEVAKDGCIGLSECITIGDVGVELIQLNQLIKVYPNPTQGEFRVDLGETTDQIEVTVCTVLGEEIQTLNNDKGNLLDITLTGAKGIYILQILSQNGLVDQIRIIKN